MIKQLLSSLAIWIFIAGGLVYAQTPTVIDPLSPISVQCVDDLPSTAGIFTEAGCPITSLSSSLAIETGRLSSSCSLTDAFYSTDVALWAIWLPTLDSLGLAPSANWVFDSSGGRMDVFLDGSAHI